MGDNNRTVRDRNVTKTIRTVWLRNRTVWGRNVIRIMRQLLVGNFSLQLVVLEHLVAWIELEIKLNLKRSRIVLARNVTRIIRELQLQLIFLMRNLVILFLDTTFYLE